MGGECGGSGISSSGHKMDASILGGFGNLFRLFNRDDLTVDMINNIAATLAGPAKHVYDYLVSSPHHMMHVALPGSREADVVLGVLVARQDKPHEEALPTGGKIIGGAQARFAERIMLLNAAEKPVPGCTCSNKPCQLSHRRAQGASAGAGAGAGAPCKCTPCGELARCMVRAGCTCLRPPYFKEQTCFHVQD